MHGFDYYDDSDDYDYDDEDDYGDEEESFLPSHVSHETERAVEEYLRAIE